MKWLIVLLTTITLVSPVSAASHPSNKKHSLPPLTNAEMYRVFYKIQQGFNLVESQINQLSYRVVVLSTTTSKQDTSMLEMRVDDLERKVRDLRDEVDTLKQQSSDQQDEIDKLKRWVREHQ